MGRVVSVGIVRGMAAGGGLVGGEEGERGGGVLSPERSLTNSWKFSGGLEVVDVEEEVEDEREGRMVGFFVVVVVEV